MIIQVGVFIFGDMEHNDEIQRLEGEIFELRDELRRTIDREVIYKEILSEINNSVNEVIGRDEENIRFKFDEVVDFKGFVHNMKDVILEYRRIYRNIDF